MRVNIELGPMAPEISEQLKDFNLPQKEVEALDQDMFAISRLHIRNIMTDNEADAAYHRLSKKITETVKQHWKSKGAK